MEEPVAKEDKEEEREKLSGAVEGVAPDGADGGLTSPRVLRYIVPAGEGWGEVTKEGDL